MSYNGNRNKDKKIENDDMNIKAHLNTSLDLDGISVSEELFQRTLAAIKEQQTQREEHVDAKGEEKFGTKITPWNRYVRSIAGVAAALLLVVVGYNVVKQMPIVKQETTSMDSAAPKANLMMKQSDSEEEKTEMAETPAGANTTADTAAKDADQVVPEANSEYTISAETFADEGTFGAAAKEDGALKATGQEGTEGETLITSIPEGKTQEFSTATVGTKDSVVTYTFRDIFLPIPEEAEYITISSNKVGTSITLTALEDIQAFYLIMDTHRFTGDGQEAANDQDYTVEMKDPNTQALYTMYLGANLMIKFTQGDNVSESVYYPDDAALLKQDIEIFLQEYSE